MSTDNGVPAAPTPAYPLKVTPPAPGVWLSAFRLAAVWMGGSAVGQIARDNLPTQYALMADPTVFGSIGLGIGATAWGLWVRRKELLQRQYLAGVVDDAVARVVSWKTVVLGWFGVKR